MEDAQLVEHGELLRGRRPLPLLCLDLRDPPLRLRARRPQLRRLWGGWGWGWSWGLGLEL